MINERSIINFFIIILAAIVGPYMIVSILEMDYLLPLVFFGLCIAAIVFFTAKDRMAALPFIGPFIAGQSHFLPGGLGFMEMFSLALISYYLIAYLALRKSPLHLGRFSISAPIFIIGLIILYHGRNFGLHALNSTSQGSRPVVIILITVITYFCGISIATPPRSFMEKIPIICCAVSVISAIPFILSTFFPSITPYLYYFTDNVNIEAYINENSSSGIDDANIGRMGVYASIGGAIQLYLISRFPIFSWWQPKMWWVAFFSLACFILTISSGYRNSVFGFIIITMAAAWCYYSWRALLIPLIFTFVFYVFLGIQLSGTGSSFLPHLPLMIQRSLSFLPGDWSSDVTSSAESSNDFRHNIIRIYEEEYLYKSPWFGNGFSIDIEESNYINDRAANSDTEDHYYQAKGFIVSKAFHTGWVSLYDAVGLIGGLAFTCLGLTLIWHFGKMVTDERDHPTSLFPIKTWIFSSMVAAFVGYFTVFGAFSSTFPSFCLFAIILYHLTKLDHEQTPSTIDL